MVVQNIVLYLEFDILVELVINYNHNYFYDF
jgi:hypothetical protein